MATPPRRPWASIGNRSAKPADAPDPGAGTPRPSDDDPLYDHHDPIPVPDAEERNTETTWALFEELSGSAKPRANEPADSRGVGSGPDSYRPRLPASESGFPDTAPAPFELRAALARDDGAGSETQPGFAHTVPASLVGVLPQGTARAAAKPRPKSVTLDEVLNLGRVNNRICPRPDIWRELWALLTRAQLSTGGTEPPLPLGGAAWAETPHLAKRMVFRSQIEWAAGQGCLPDVGRFLRALNESDWYHFGE